MTQTEQVLHTDLLNKVTESENTMRTREGSTFTTIRHSQSHRREENKDRKCRETHKEKTTACKQKVQMRNSKP